jgi:hypothetical protein
MTSTLTRRRIGGAVLVLGGLAVAILVLWPRGGDGGARADPVRLVSVPQLGLAFAHPATWSRSVGGRVLRLRSPEGSAVLTITSPVRGRHTPEVKAALKRTLRTRLAPATIVRDGRGLLGARSVSTFELRGHGAHGRVRALALVDSTPYRTYAVTLLTPDRPSRRRLAEVQRILATVRFTKPARLDTGNAATVRRQEIG